MKQIIILALTFISFKLSAQNADTLKAEIAFKIEYNRKVKDSIVHEVQFVKSTGYVVLDKNKNVITYLNYFKNSFSKLPDLKTISYILIK